MFKKIKIYGERCSGTNYLREIIRLNFDVETDIQQYGHKHFFGFSDLKNSDDTLFICIVRHPIDWINSLYRTPHHIFQSYFTHEEKLDNFLNKEIISNNNKGEIINDRNMYTGERYKNIFELRHTKLKWMIEDLPNKVKNYIFIKYEDLLNDFDNTLLKIKNKGLTIKENINFPVNSDNYKGDVNIKYVKKIDRTISDEIILTNPNLIPFYEYKLNYILKKE
jgi:hypothetical protein